MSISERIKQHHLTSFKFLIMGVIGVLCSMIMLLVCVRFFFEHLLFTIYLSSFTLIISVSLYITGIVLLRKEIKGIDPKNLPAETEFEKKLTLRKILIGGTVLAYLFGVVFEVVGRLLLRQDFNWEMIYGPLITIAFYWLIGGLVALFMWARAKRKRKLNR